jgi:uncharacterized protein
LDLALIPVFIVIGCVVGFIAGLLGIGGGLTMIPLLTLLFTYEQFPPGDVLHIAVATSMATIVFTSIASVRAHHQHRAVLWSVFWRLAPGILIGSLVGPQIVSGMSTRLLSGVFVLFASYTGLRLIRNTLPKPTRELPGTLGLWFSGAAIGVISSMVGAGGGFISVPFMTACNVRLQNAVATSAALGLPIAAAGTVGFLIAGFRHPGLPPYTVGYIYLPALIAIVSASVVVAPIGVRMAHRWPAAQLRHAFAALMFGIAGFFFWKLIKG